MTNKYLVYVLIFIMSNLYSMDNKLEQNVTLENLPNELKTKIITSEIDDIINKTQDVKEAIKDIIIYTNKIRILNQNLDHFISGKNLFEFIHYDYYILQYAGKRIKEKFDVNTHMEFKGSQANHLLTRACEIGNLNLVRLLIFSGTDLDLKMKCGTSALMVSIIGGHEKVAELLIASGANVNSRTIFGTTTLTRAVEWHQNEYIIKLLIFAGAIDEDSQALNLAVRKNLKNIFHFLIKHGSQTNFLDDEDNTLLMLAIEHNCSASIIKFLVADETDINTQNKLGKTALMLAAQHNNKNLFEFLISNGAKTNIKDKIGNTPLIQAIMNRCNKAIIKLLITSGVDINAQNKFGTTALMLAAKQNRKNIFSFLIKHGADTSIKDEHGNTAISYLFKQSKVKKNSNKKLKPNAIDVNNFGQ